MRIFVVLLRDPGTITLCVAMHVLKIFSVDMSLSDRCHYLVTPATFPG